MENTEKPKVVYREVGAEVVEKSAAEREAEVIAAAEEQKRIAEENKANSVAVEEKKNENAFELDDTIVLDYVKKKLNKEVTSFDDLFQERVVEPELPEDVAAFAKYKKETGRGFEDFMKLQKDFDSLPDTVLLKEYLSATEEGLETEDIESLIEGEYTFDEEFDDPKDIAAKKRKLKKTLSEAKRYFNEEKEKYKAPLESKRAEIPRTELEEFNAYKERLKNAQSEQEAIQKQSQYFEQKTNELFSPEFKGFKFKVNDKEVVVPMGDPNELKVQHMSPRNLIMKFVDQETGLLKDAEGYHKALAAAMNPEKLAQHFYELGKAEAVESLDKEMKNINMSERKFPANPSKTGVKYREVPSKDY